MLPQHAIVESTRRLPKGQRHERMEKDDHRKQSEKWDGEYKRCTLAKGNGKVKIIWRGLGNDDRGWRGGSGVGG